MRLLGLGGYHSLPFSILQYYLHLVKATNCDVESIFKNTDPKELAISYQKVMYGYKELLATTNIFNRRNCMTQLRDESKITANNPIILKELTFSMFETYRYIVEKLLKSKYKSFSDILNTAFE